MKRNQAGLLLLGALIIAGALWWRSAGPANGAMVDVKVPALSEVGVQGETLFNRHCASCHGKNAAGSDKGPPLVHIYYEPNHHGDGAFYFAVQNGVQQHHWTFGNMAPLGLPETEVSRIIAYIRELQRHNGIN